MILTIFAGLLFYHIITFYKGEFIGFSTVGLISLVFAFIGYLLYAFIGVHKTLKGFIWLYYAFGFISLFYSVLILRFNIIYLLGLLIMLTVSLVLTRWRIGVLREEKGN